jgi:hypothetical protein
MGGRPSMPAKPFSVAFKLSTANFHKGDLGSVAIISDIILLIFSRNSSDVRAVSNVSRPLSMLVFLNSQTKPGPRINVNMGTKITQISETFLVKKFISFLSSKWEIRG